MIQLLAGDSSLGSSTVELLSEALERFELAVSSVVFTETARLHLAGRLDLGMSPERWMRERLRDGLRVVSVTAEIAVAASMLETTGFHGDPMDRFIAATAMSGDHTLVTSDRRIVEWANRTRLLSVVAPTG
ncbi:type II toxin-antitoxin system VapC family toxin [Candidatus Poriferisodalis sp.]|uniref:type II toxin-antitoxin system VapC family toxin n=1 Tax=Candidatus Poriferisodalis sp. TaxID=3101277 RepID=UPI003C6EB1BA